MAFHLPVDAPMAAFRAARDGLRKELCDALRLSITAASPPAGPVPPSWQPEGTNAGLWFDPTAPLVINDSGVSGTEMMSEGPYRYVRILPRSWLQPAEYGADGGRPAILGPTSGCSWGTIKGGYLTYSGSIRGTAAQSPLSSLVMQFRATGEIWGVDDFAANGEGGDRFFACVFRKIPDSYFTKSRTGISVNTGQ